MSEKILQNDEMFLVLWRLEEHTLTHTDTRFICRVSTYKSNSPAFMVVLTGGKPGGLSAQIPEVCQRGGYMFSLCLRSENRWFPAALYRSHGPKRECVRTSVCVCVDRSRMYSLPPSCVRWLDNGWKDIQWNIFSPSGLSSEHNTGSFFELSHVAYLGLSPYLCGMSCY